MLARVLYALLNKYFFSYLDDTYDFLKASRVTFFNVYKFISLISFQ